MLQLPTDNFYKFFALSGLLIAVFSIYFPIKEILKLEEKILQREIEVATMEVESDYIEKKKIYFNL